MLIPEQNPIKCKMDQGDAYPDLTATLEHYDDTLSQSALKKLAVSVSVQLMSVEQSDKVKPWITSAPYVERQATRSLRILMIATEAPPVRGGIARAVGYLRDGFQARGHHVDVLAYPMVRRIVYKEVRLSSLIFKLPKLLTHIKEYDIIHVHGTTPTVSDVALLFLHFISLCGSTPHVIYTHHMDLDFGPAGFLNKVYNYLHHKLSASAKAVIASTSDNLRMLGGSSAGMIIPYGVDLSRFSSTGQKDDQFTVLCIGQFRPYKGIRVLLQAMSKVTDTRLILAGQGPEEQVYRSLAAELDLDVEFHISVDDDQLRLLYQRAHTVVLPSVSRLEAFGLVLVEGMAAGCIPIASNLPGVREAVGSTGFLFPVGDVDELAGILRRLRDDSVLMQQISDLARVRAADFSQERSINEYERLITELIVCRDLKDRLADQKQSCEVILQAFATDVTYTLEADWTQVVLRQTKGRLYPVIATEPMKLTDHRQLQQVAYFLTEHAINTGNSVLIGPNNDPLHLRNAGIHEIPAAIATPLTIDRRRFGVLLAMRERPFQQHDLSSLKRFAHYAAPSMQTLMKVSI